MRKAILARLAVAACMLAAASCAGAQDEPTYKCVSHGRVVYTQVPCTGGRELGMARHRETSRWKVPPQDRALIARRARLTPEQRKTCSMLDVRMKEQQAQLKAKGTAATLQDEMPFVHSEKQYRELHC